MSQMNYNKEFVVFNCFGYGNEKISVIFSSKIKINIEKKEKEIDLTR